MLGHETAMAERRFRFPSACGGLSYYTGLVHGPICVCVCLARTTDYCILSRGAGGWRRGWGHWGSKFFAGVAGVRMMNE